MGISVITKLQEFFSFILVIIFVFETHDDIKVKTSFKTRAAITATVVGLTLSIDFLQFLVWEYPKELSLFSLLICTVTVSSYVAGLHFIEPSHYEPPSSTVGFEAQERYRLLLLVAAFTSMIYPLLGTLVSRAFFYGLYIVVRVC